MADINWWKVAESLEMQAGQLYDAALKLDSEGKHQASDRFRSLGDTAVIFSAALKAGYSADK